MSVSIPTAVRSLFISLMTSERGSRHPGLSPSDAFLATDRGPQWMDQARLSATARLRRHLVTNGAPPITRTILPTCRAYYPRRIGWVRVSIASPRVQPFAIGRRVCIRIITFEACSSRAASALRSPRHVPKPICSAACQARCSCSVRNRPGLRPLTRPIPPDEEPGEKAGDHPRQLPAPRQMSKRPCSRE